MSNVALLSNGAFNNYVDKKRWVWISRKSTLGWPMLWWITTIYNTMKAYMNELILRQYFFDTHYFQLLGLRSFQK